MMLCSCFSDVCILFDVKYFLRLPLIQVLVTSYKFFSVKSTEICKKTVEIYDDPLILLDCT